MNDLSKLMNEPRANIGKTGSIEENGLHILVTIKDHTRPYGQHRYLVTPVAGEGEAWVNAERVKIVVPSPKSAS